jgi:hypothetical protein
MPLRCLDPTTNVSIHAFDLSAEEWQALVLKNRGERHLKMPCCSSQVTLKRSRLGTQFFAHKAVNHCSTAPETEIHLRLKQIAVAVARASGWSAETEVVGTTPAGEQWKADVLAQKGNWKVAVEVQWSSQTNEETLRRQQQYAESSIRGLWLLRQREIPITRDLPAARIEGSPRDGFYALVPRGWGERRLPMQEFLHAAFNRHLRFRIPIGAMARVSVLSGNMDCWHSSCDATTRIITHIIVTVGLDEYVFHVSELGEYSEAFNSIRKNLPDYLIRPVKFRYSKTQERSYMSNGCARCDRLFGGFFEHDAYYNEEKTFMFPMIISEGWRQAIEEHHGDEPGWGVYSMDLTEASA